MINKLFRLLFFSCCLVYIVPVQAQLVVNNLDASSLQVLEELIVTELLGCDLQISNIEYSGNAESVGSFSYINNQTLCGGGFDMDRGFLMTTGGINHAVGPNNNGDDGEEWSLQYNDDFLQNYLSNSAGIDPSVNLYDASILEFDIESFYDTSLSFDVVFGSEEYVEWMSPFYADVFCFFVSEIDNDIDPNFNSVPQNIMETGNVLNVDPNQCIDVSPIDNKPISVWTIRPYSQVFNLPGLNECLYLDNENGQFCNAVGYDGYTIPMLFGLNLVANAKYHIKMIIVDGGGPALDSGVFIKKSSFDDMTEIDFSWSNPEYNEEGATVSFSNMSANNLNVTYFWDFNNDGIIDSNDANPTYTFDESGSYLVTLEILNDCLDISDSVSYSIVIDPVNLHESNNKVTIYPNPTSNAINIQMSNLQSAYFLNIIDVSGRVLLSKELIGANSFVNLLDLKKGMYYVSLNNVDGVMHFEKLIIN